MSGSSKLPRRYRPDDRGRYRLRPEWLRAETAISVGLIVLGVYILQAFISTGVNDVAGRIALIAWVVAIPWLALLAMLTQVLGSFRFFVPLVHRSRTRVGSRRCADRLWRRAMALVATVNFRSRGKQLGCPRRVWARLWPGRAGEPRRQELTRGEPGDAAGQEQQEDHSDEAPCRPISDL